MTDHYLTCAVNGIKHCVLSPPCVGWCKRKSPQLSTPPVAVYDTAKVRLGDGFISARFPSRRALLRSTALFPVALAGAGCQTVADIVAITPKIASYIDTIAKVAAVVTPAIFALVKVGTGVGNVVSTALTDIQMVAHDISTATTTTASGLIQKLGSAGSTLVGLLGPVVGIPVKVVAFLQNMSVLIPEIETAFGIKAAAPAARFGRFAATISPDQAHANLQALLHR